MNLNSIKHMSVKYSRLILCTTWLFTTLFYLKLYGIFTGLEAEKYINEAHTLIETGSFSAPRFWFYSITIFILAIAFKLKIGITGAFIIQGLLNLFAYLFFLKALTELFKSTVTALLIVIYLLVFLPYQTWVVFFFTESAFFSMILILFSFIILNNPLKYKNVIGISLLLLLVIMGRPLGLLFAGSTYVYLFYNANIKWKKILGFSGIFLFAAAYYSINIIFSTISDWHITKPFEEESIICNLPSELPHAVLKLSSEGSPIYQLYYYLTNNFPHFLHFTGVKLNYFFLMARPYYSKPHNYFLIFNTIAIYILSFAGFFLRQPYFKKGVVPFCVCSIFLYTITIIFQCDDYHNRFILSIYPFFVILATRGIQFFSSLLLKNNK